MGRERGVIPQRVRLPLSHGDWIDVKNELNAGEYWDLISSQRKENADGDKVVLDYRNLAWAKVLAYLVGWSFVSVVDHQPIPYDLWDPEDVRLTRLRDLDADTVREVREAIAAHETKMDEAREAKKNSLATASAS